ncbi:polysaccharide pyruvyl transferase family protein [Novosphingobium sp. BL-8A]|uniref:polysaccharide pyruvyl transferase family protein n=1 Tax=Novosphingobium sp. BL-8A TaxID=3127639 RepID=UPI0037573F2C
MTPSAPAAQQPADTSEPISETNGATPPSSHSARRLRLFNVKFSPNLGDGLLSECLEQALVDSGAHPDTHSIDLAARTAFGPGSPGRATQLRLLASLPPPLRQLAVRAPLTVAAHRTWRPHYEAALDGADAVVIGGGNLLADLDLNFPTKLALVTDAAARRGLPVFIYGCGVSPRWSKAGRRLLARMLNSGALHGVFVRDEASRQAWDGLSGARAGLPAQVVRDPGLLAAERYGIPPVAKPSPQATVGLNITDPVALRYHADDALPAPAQERWYLDCARGLLDAGHSLTVFTNGSPEDRACLARLRPAIEAMAAARNGAGPAVFFPEAADPAMLARLIGSLRGLVAFRMHAVIAAYSCGVPFLALAWDGKLAAFLRSVSLETHLCRPTVTPPVEAVAALSRIMAQGIDPRDRARVLAETREGVERLQAAIAASLGTRR